jgi:hypothetical protein
MRIDDSSRTADSIDGRTALATSALRLLGEHRKAPQPHCAGTQQNLELPHDAPFNLADISADSMNVRGQNQTEP